MPTLCGFIVNCTTLTWSVQVAPSVDYQMQFLKKHLKEVGSDYMLYHTLQYCACFSVSVLELWLKHQISHHTRQMLVILLQTLCNQHISSLRSCRNLCNQRISSLRIHHLINSPRHSLISHISQNRQQTEMLQKQSLCSKDPQLSNPRMMTPL